MKKISSDWTWFTKWGMPIIFLGPLTLIFASGLWNAIAEPGSASLGLIVVPLIMAGMFYLMMRKFIFDLVDEIWDDGDALVARNKGVEARIELRKIVNITDLTTANWPRVTLLLREPCELGSSVSFHPVGSRSFFRGNAVALDLIQRVDIARLKSQPPA
jgi:hypothetical protein